MEGVSPKLTPFLLNETNYLIWRNTASTSLCGRGKWEHVKPTEPLPKENEEGYSKWFQEDQMVKAWIQASLESHILAAYAFCLSAKDLWDALEATFGNKSNLCRIYEIKKRLGSLQQDSSFISYLGEARTLMAELDGLRPPTTSLAKILERREQDSVFTILAGLKPCFQALTQHILRMDKLPSLNEVIAMIQREESSQRFTNGNVEEVAAKAHVQGKKMIRCEHCKKLGHIKDKCWILHPHLKPKKREGFWASEVMEHQENHGQASNSSQALSATLGGDAIRDQVIAALKEFGITKGGNSKALLGRLDSSALVIDSGASHHMIKDKELINDLNNYDGKVKIANGLDVPIKGIGNIDLLGKESKALYLPSFSSNLISVRRATKDLNCQIIFDSNKVIFQDIESKKELGEGRIKNGLYKMTSPTQDSNFCMVASSSLWHDRLGHPHERALNILLPRHTFDHEKCEACIYGKQCRPMFFDSHKEYNEPFELIHSDLWTSPCVSRNNFKYFITFIDQKTKYTWLYLLTSKSGAFQAFTKFHNHVKNFYNARIKILRTDNGGEFMNKDFDRYLEKQGIVHQTSCPYTPQQNGVAERKNRHLMEVARTLMFRMNVPRRHWGDAVSTACYLINKLPTKTLNDRSPYEELNGSKPNLDYLRVFGCTCYVHVPENQRDKLEPKSIKCVFIGYSPTQKGYKCFEPKTNRVHISRSVVFLENVPFYSTEQVGDSGLPSLAPLVPCEGVSYVGPQEESRQDDDHQSEGEHQVEESESFEETQEQSLQEGDDSEAQHQEDTMEGEQETQEAEPTLRRSTRIRRPTSEWMKHRVYFNGFASKYPIQDYCSLSPLSIEHQGFLSAIDKDREPETFEEAQACKEWCQAMKEELNALIKNGTWDLVELPKGKKAVGCKWVYKIKYRSDGLVERYKARLVAKGFTQTYGVDYTETFAPVVKLNTVRVILSLAINRKWSLHQMDVKNAFLQGELEEEVYMHPPPGLEQSDTYGKVCRLKKAIYGLKQSPRMWYNKLSQALIKKDFKKSPADSSLFTLQRESGIVVLLIYVDDIIISGNDETGIHDVKEYLKYTFDIKDLGELTYFLGIEIVRSSEGLFLCQRKYTLDLLDETGKIGAKPARTPLEVGYKELKGEPLKDPTQYRRLVGKLIYLTITRPDISFSVNQVSRHMGTPHTNHMKMVDRILKYLKASPGKGIMMRKHEGTDIVGYCDADWAGCKEDRRSTTGFCTFVGGNLVTWKSKKQSVVARSSAEAEYRAMATVTSELVWLKSLLKDLNVEVTKPIKLHCDNQAAIHIASNPVFHERTKHIEVDCHFVREKVQEGVISPSFVKSKHQLADVFTKLTSAKECEEAFSKLGLTDPHNPSLRGNVKSKAKNLAHIPTRKHLGMDQPEDIEVVQSQFIV